MIPSQVILMMTLRGLRKTHLWVLFLQIIFLMNMPLVPEGRRAVLESPSQHFKVLVWNVQGAGSREFRNILREHLQVHRPSIIGLVETRISDIRAREVYDLSLIHI